MAVGAGVLIAIPALSVAFMAQPDNFALFQPLVAGALWMTARGLKGSPRSFVLAGLPGRPRHAVADRRRAGPPRRPPGFAWTARGAGRDPGERGVGAVAAFVLVMAPWWIRQLAVFGTLSPSMASGKVLFIRSIGEWDSIATPATLEHLLGMGAGPLIASRVGGVPCRRHDLRRADRGSRPRAVHRRRRWARRRSVDFGPFFTYAAVLFGFSALLSAVHVPGGTFIHSAVALAPHSYVLALGGVAAVVAWFGRRRPAWDPGPTTRLATVGVVAVVVLGALTSVGVVHAGWAPGVTACSQCVTRWTRPVRRHGTGHVDRRGGDPLLDRPGWRRPRQRPGRHDRRGRRRLRRRLARARSRGGRHDDPILDGDRPGWLGAPILEDGDPTELGVYLVDQETAE